MIKLLAAIALLFLGVFELFMTSITIKPVTMLLVGLVLIVPFGPIGAVIFVIVCLSVGYHIKKHGTD